MILLYLGQSTSDAVLEFSKELMDLIMRILLQWRCSKTGTLDEFLPAFAVRYKKIKLGGDLNSASASA